jgi:hypothetical protein
MYNVYSYTKLIYLILFNVIQRDVSYNLAVILSNINNNVNIKCNSVMAHQS